MARQAVRSRSAPPRRRRVAASHGAAPARARTCASPLRRARRAARGGSRRPRGRAGRRSACSSSRALRSASVICSPSTSSRSRDGQLLDAGEQAVELAAAHARLAERGEDAVRREHGVVDAPGGRRCRRRRAGGASSPRARRAGGARSAARRAARRASAGGAGAGRARAGAPDARAVHRAATARCAAGRAYVLHGGQSGVGRGERRHLSWVRRRRRVGPTGCGERPPASRRGDGRLRKRVAELAVERPPRGRAPTAWEYRPRGADP